MNSWDDLYDSNAECGENVYIEFPVNIYGCMIGDHVRIGPFVEIQKGVIIGDRVKIGSHTFICEGVTVEDDVFVGHGVMFTNDRHPRASIDDHLKERPDWRLEDTLVMKGASIGTGAVILPGVVIGSGAMVGAGAVVTKDVARGQTVYGNPAR
tara:strand:- start:48 stop:506 length:459 start_codon:yes stop_codon:yes gene_type:complete